MNSLRRISFVLGLSAIALSACFAGTGSTGGGTSSSSPSAAPFSENLPEAAPRMTAAAGGSDTLPPRSELSDGLQDGDVVLTEFRAFLTPKPYNTQEPYDASSATVEAKGTLNLTFLGQGGFKLKDPEPGESPIAWMGYLQGPRFRIVKTPKPSPASAATPVIQDQMGAFVLTDKDAGETGYNGVIKDLPVSEGDEIAIYIFDKAAPKCSNIETCFLKPPDDMAAFLADEHTHLAARFTIRNPAPPPAAEKAIPSGTPITRPEIPSHLRDFFETK